MPALVGLVSLRSLTARVFVPHSESGERLVDVIELVEFAALYDRPLS